MSLLGYSLSPATCARCGKAIKLFDKVQFNKATKRCSTCEAEVREALANFRQAFLASSADGLMTAAEWDQLVEMVKRDAVELEEALGSVRGEAIQLLERTLAIAAADGMLTDGEERDFLQLQGLLQVPSDMILPQIEWMRYLRHITQIRRGDLPTYETSVRLASDEICHLEVAATYQRVTHDQIMADAGRLLASSKRLYFFSPNGDIEVAYAAISRVEQRSGGVYLQLDQRLGSGFYGLEDSKFVAAIIETLARRAGGLRDQQAQTDQGHIPRDVKIAVWKRDQGRCAECGSQSYLEFHHIIPPAKGGASSAPNVQLLCQTCYGTKGALD